MNKKTIAQKIFSLATLYNDYIEHGFIRKHEIPDFSYMDAPQQGYIPKEEKTKQYNSKLKIDTKKRKIIELAENILSCQQCPLYKNVKKIPGAGDVNAKIFIISYPASIEEEIAGRPLVGKIGDFFKKWMNAIDINFNDIFITNLLKCPPKKNPITKENIETCKKHLDKQLEIIQPELILSLGQLTLSSLKKTFTDINSNHGQIFYYNNIPLFPTFHPMDVLSNPLLKKIVWEDLKKIQEFFKKNL